MKRAMIALAVVGFAVAAIGIARANSGADTPVAKPSPTDESRVDKSREFDRELTAGQIQAQADQTLKAQQELARKVAEEADMGSHTLVVTIREESPGAVWVVGKVDGDPACVTPPKDTPTYVVVSVAGIPGSELTSKLAPLEAKLLKSGACEATLELFVPQMDRYEITVTGAGHGTFDPVRVRSKDQPQKVTIVG
jgi:hypothetical protein